MRRSIALLGTLVVACLHAQSGRSVLYSATNPVFSINAMSSDPSGNIYLVGTTSSSLFPTTPGGVQAAIGGRVCLSIGFGPGGSGLSPCEDAVLMKLDRTASIAVATAAPGLFLADFVTTQGAIQNSDGSFNSAANPAAKGSLVALYGTGAGPMSPTGVTGGVWPFDPLSHLALPVTAKVLGIDAEVVYSGAAPGLSSGFFQINLRVPASAPTNSTAPIQLTIGGTIFNLNATLAVR